MKRKERCQLTDIVKKFLRSHDVLFLYSYSLCVPCQIASPEFHWLTTLTLEFVFQVLLRKAQRGEYKRFYFPQHYRQFAYLQASVLWFSRCLGLLRNVSVFIRIWHRE